MLPTYDYYWHSYWFFKGFQFWTGQFTCSSYLNKSCYLLMIGTVSTKKTFIFFCYFFQYGSSGSEGFIILVTAKFLICLLFLSSHSSAVWLPTFIPPPPLSIHWMKEVEERYIHTTVPVLSTYPVPPSKKRYLCLCLRWSKVGSGSGYESRLKVEPGSESKRLKSATLICCQVNHIDYFILKNNKEKNNWFFSFTVSVIGRGIPSTFRIWSTVLVMFLSSCHTLLSDNK